MIKRKSPILVLAVLITALVSPSLFDCLRASAQDGVADPGVVRAGEVEIAVRAGFNRFQAAS